MVHKHHVARYQSQFGLAFDLNVISKNVVWQLNLNCLVVAIDVLKSHTKTAEKRDHHVVTLVRLVVSEVAKHLEYLFGAFNMDIGDLLVRLDVPPSLPSH